MVARLTKRQEEVLDFIRDCVVVEGVPPTSREIQEHFGFASQNAAMDHLRALERKGAVRRLPGKARAVVPAGCGCGVRAKGAAVGRVVRSIPLYGRIAAGMPAEAVEDAGERIAVDADLLGLPGSAGGVFALRVGGDSMTGAHILDGDIVVIEARPPRPGEIVAALIDGETTLKRFLVRRGKPYLKAENPRYPELAPAAELVIQGVMVALMRRAGKA